MYTNTQGAGTCVGTPDICLTPAGIPVPFTNTAMCANGVGFVPYVFIVNGCVHNLMTTIVTSTGDEPGVLGGVVSGTFCGAANYTAGCTTVLTGGAPTARLTSTTMQNNKNCMGATVVPSQTTVKLLAP